MPTIDVQVPADGGSARAWLSVPDGAGPWPAVIMYPDAGSLREVFRQMGGRLASEGYVVLVPDIYYRDGEYPPFSIATAFTDPDERARLGRMAGSITHELAGRDARAFADFLDGRPETQSGPIGTIGYCLGGRLSLTAAGALGDRVGAAAPFHGGRLAVEGDPGSPHLFAADVAAIVYVGGAADDDSFDDEQAERLDDAYRDAGVQHTIETYAAAHGFVVADNPTFDHDAAERHWSAASALFAAALA